MRQGLGTGDWGLGTGKNVAATRDQPLAPSLQPLEVTVISSGDYDNLTPPDGRCWADRKTLETVWLELGKILYWELTPFMEFQGEGARLKESEIAR